MNTNKCRICFGKDFLTNIFNLHGSFSLASKIMSVAEVHIAPDDGLPTTICKSCVERLNICIEFIEQCKNSDEELRSSLLNTVNEKGIETYPKSDFDYEDSKCSPKSSSDLFIDEDEHCNMNLNNFLSQTIHKDTNSRKFNYKKTCRQQCPVCGKIMSSGFRLKTHLRIHTGEKPFNCLQCKKKFSLAENLKVHMRIHTGEKPHKCTACGQSFAHSAGLAVHKRKHTGQTPYRCLLCLRSFRTIGHLQYHVRCHTGEKNFVCDTCGRAFITRSDLKKHLQTHTDDRSHVCCVCGLRLSRASHLKRHMKHTHTDTKLVPDTQCHEKIKKIDDLENYVKENN